MLTCNHSAWRVCASSPLSTASTSLSMASLIMRGQMKNWAHLEKTPLTRHSEGSTQPWWFWSYPTNLTLISNSDSNLKSQTRTLITKLCSMVLFLFPSSILWLWFWPVYISECIFWESAVMYLSSASRNLFLCTSNWNTVLSQSVEALSLPPCFFRNTSNPFSQGYFSLPINTTNTGRGTGVKKITVMCHIQFYDLGHSPCSSVSFTEIKEGL